MTIITAIDDTPEELFGPYVDNRHTSLEFLSDIQKLTDEDTKLHEVFSVSSRTLEYWFNKSKIPSQINANKITFLYLMLYDKVLFMSIICNIIDSDIVKDSQYKNQTLNRIYLFNQFLYTILLFRESIEKDDYDNSKYDAIKFIWKYIDKIIQQLCVVKVWRWDFKEVSNNFNHQLQRFYNCECSDINEYYDLFKTLNILNSLED